MIIDVQEIINGRTTQNYSSEPLKIIRNSRKKGLSPGNEY